MLPVLFYLAMSNVIGEAPFAPGIAAIESQARLFPPKRSPWHGQGAAALKVTLWESPGEPRKMRIDATQDGNFTQDTYWFEDGKLAWGAQSRGDLERRLVFAGGRLKSAEERRGGRWFPLVARDLERLDQDAAALVRTCLNAPGLRSRTATVKAVEPARVVFDAGGGLEAWVSRRQGDKVAASLVGRKATYDFTAVEVDGHEVDYLNLIQPVAGKAAPAKKAVKPGAKRAKKKRAPVKK